MLSADTKHSSYRFLGHATQAHGSNAVYICVGQFSVGVVFSRRKRYFPENLRPSAGIMIISIGRVRSSAFIHFRSVLKASPRMKVGGVHAFSIADVPLRVSAIAGMENPKFSGVYACGQEVCHASRPKLVGVVYAELSIATIKTANPRPAIIGTANINLGPESSNVRFRKRREGLTLITGHADLLERSAWATGDWYRPWSCPYPTPNEHRNPNLDYRETFLLTNCRVCENMNFCKCFHRDEENEREYSNDGRCISQMPCPGV